MLTAILQGKAQSQPVIALSKIVITALDHSIITLEQEPAELYALQCIIKLVAVISTSKEARELCFELNKTKQ